MRKTILGFALGAMLLALCVTAQAQQPAKISRIGFVLTTSTQITAENWKAFRQTLRELGHVEGKNINFEYRYIEGQQDKVPNLVGELLDLKVDVLVVSTLSSLRAAKQATKTTPIVMKQLMIRWRQES